MNGYVLVDNIKNIPNVEDLLHLNFYDDFRFTNIKYETHRMCHHAFMLHSRRA